MNIPDKKSREEILFAYHKHGDIVFPDIEALKGDLTTIYTHSDVLKAMQQYADQEVKPYKDLCDSLFRKLITLMPKEEVEKLTTL